MVKFTVHKAKIVNVAADAIIYSANADLTKGTGMSKDVFNAAGEYKLISDLRQYRGRLNEGEAVITRGFDLAAGHIIHTVVPKYYIEREGKYADFSMCFVNSLKVANDRNIKILAVPCIGTGASGWPLEECISICLDTLMWTLQNHGEYSIKRIMLIAYDDKQYEMLSMELWKRRNDYNIEV